MEITADNATSNSSKTLTTVVYALYALSCLVGVTALIAVIINYVKRADVAGTYIESHFRWQIATFWFGLLWWIVGVVTLPLYGAGMVALLANFVWVLYRIVKGWLRLNDEKPMYAA